MPPKPKPGYIRYPDVQTPVTPDDNIEEDLFRAFENASDLYADLIWQTPSGSIKAHKGRQSKARTFTF